MSDILPKPKPKNFTKILDMLNTKAAANQFSPKTYVNLVGEFSKKAFDNGELSEREYMKIIKPLFGDAGIMASKKIQEEKDYLEKYAQGGRVNFLSGGDTKYNAMVTRMYIEAGGEEATGMDIDSFAEKYFKKFNKGGRVNYGGGSDMGSVADSQGNVGSGTGGYQGGPQGGYGDAGRGGGNDNPTFAPKDPPKPTNDFLKDLLKISPNFTGNPYDTRLKTQIGPFGLDLNTLGILGIDDPRTLEDETKIGDYNINVGGSTDLFGGNLNFGAGYNPETGPSMGLGFYKQFNKGGRVNYGDGSPFNDYENYVLESGLSEKVKELMDDGYEFGEAVKQAMKEAKSG